MRLAVIVPRYGPDIAGGAEQLALGLAEAGVQQGWTVEAWTTCVQDHYTWRNSLPPGEQHLNGVLVRRFPVEPWDSQQRAALEQKLAVRQTLSRREQYQWMASGPSSRALYAHAARHASDFDVLLTMPYLMSISYYAAWIAPERTLVAPCLHDEAYAYLEPIRLLLENVRGVLFNTPEEQWLATRRLKFNLQRQAVLGIGVPPVELPTSPAVRPQLLYVGRLEGGKNVPLLYEYVQRYAAEQGDIRLAVAGRGPLEPPRHPAFSYLGYVSDKEKARACATSLALCQPSVNESFSFTIMESWLAKRPVLVHGGSPVTRGHVQRSKGGLWFHDYDEFAEAVSWLQANPALADEMGANGYEYVRRNYSWQSIIRRFAQIVDRWNLSSAVESLSAPEP